MSGSLSLRRRFRRLTGRLFILVLVPLAVLGGCGGGGGGGTPPPDNGGNNPGPPDTTPPTVSSTSPVADATGVSVSDAFVQFTVQVTFSESMKNSSLNGTTFTLSDGAPVAGSVSLSGKTATFTPSSGLSGSTLYTATVTTGAKDRAGNPIEAAYSWSFTTGTVVSDPLFQYQWHLKNTGQNGATSGEDINVEPAWNAGFTGAGINIVAVDDGLEIAHEDLADNVVAGASWNYLTLGHNPTGGEHGTSVGGVAAAISGNAFGGRGVAYDAGIFCYNMLQSSVLSDEADSMTRGLANFDISSNSWGPADGTGLLDAPSAAFDTALDTGVTTGRGGKGAVYTWAAGNGAGSQPEDLSNYDGYANHREVIAVCAVGDDGVRSWYSEAGANLWVCAPSEGGSGQAITTTDRSGSLGYNGGGGGDYWNANYTNTFNGTSSATPVVSGVAALMLDANPDLTWRDVKLVLAESTRKNHPGSASWFTNDAGYDYSELYGFGVVDANAAVALAQTWTNVAAEVTYSPLDRTPALAIPDSNSTGVNDTLVVSGSGISSLEWVYVYFSAADHPRSGDLEVTLTNVTTGDSVYLAQKHSCVSTGCSDYDEWRFSAAAFLGESANGSWKLTVKDLTAGSTGHFQSWRMEFFGH